MVEVEDIKKGRAAARRKLTVIARRITRSLQKDQAASQVEDIHKELEAAFINFCCKDEEFKQYLNDNPTLKEEHSMVNRKDPDTYAAEAIYEDAARKYKEFNRNLKQKKKEKERRLKEEKEKVEERLKQESQEKERRLEEEREKRFATVLYVRQVRDCALRKAGSRPLCFT